MEIFSWNLLSCLEENSSFTLKEFFELPATQLIRLLKIAFFPSWDNE